VKDSFMGRPYDLSVDTEAPPAEPAGPLGCELEVDDELRRGTDPANVRAGACWPAAYGYVTTHLGDPRMRLVHGTYGNDQFGHAWVEIDERVIYDGTVQRFFDLGCYYQLRGLKSHAQYSAREAIEAASRLTQEYGGSIDYPPVVTSNRATRGVACGGDGKVCVATSQSKAPRRAVWCASEEESSRPVDRRVTLLFPPAVLVTTLIFPADLAVVSLGPRSLPPSHGAD
jgi:hypothetical protein